MKWSSKTRDYFRLGQCASIYVMRYALNYTISYPLVSLKRSPELRIQRAGKFSIAPTANACVMECPSIKGFWIESLQKQAWRKSLWSESHFDPRDRIL
jgi:hypothetical protein